MKIRETKRFISVILVSCVFFTSTLADSVQAQNAETNGQKLEKMVRGQSLENSDLEEITQEEEQANEDYAEIMEVVSEETESGEMVYEDYYGGTYLDDEGKLVVQVADASPEEVKDIENIANSDIIIEEVENSYEDLNEIYDKISNQFVSLTEQQMENGIEDLELDELTNNMTGVSIDETENTVIVFLQEVTEKAKVQFEKYYGNLGVVFEKGETENDNAEQIKLGRAIYTSKSKMGSVGMKAYYVNSKGEKVKGFVTAAHLFQGIGDPVYIMTSANKLKKIGKVTKWKYGGNMDAAFVKITNSNYVPSRKVYYSDSRGTISDKYKLKSYTYLSGTYVGASLYKSGADTYLTKGRVTSTSKTIRSSDTKVVFKDLWQADYDCANGDSGGAVFDVQCSAIAGIHRGSSGTSTKWENIADEWGLHEY